jgi:D-glycero-alpha-D-manno-heptose-7-phosphate kinase
LIDSLYETVKNEGAYGGKVSGAGGGGFLLVFAKPEFHKKIKTALNNLIHVPFEFENTGSRVILYQPQSLDLS